METVDYLHNSGAKEIHVRSACPPLLFGCKFHNFSRSVSDLELITRRTICKLEGIEHEQVTREILDKYANPETEEYANMVESIREEMGFDSLKFQTLENTKKAIRIDPCKLCTYCWDGKE
jgi:amidophosphoribosyltransferase